MAANIRAGVGAVFSAGMTAGAFAPTAWPLKAVAVVPLRRWLTPMILVAFALRRMLYSYALPL